MSDFSAFVLNLSKSGDILFRKMPNGNCLFCSASLLLVASARNWLVFAAKYHASQKIIHNSVKPYDILIELKVLESL